MYGNLNQKKICRRTYSLYSYFPSFPFSWYNPMIQKYIPSKPYRISVVSVWYHNLSVLNLDNLIIRVYDYLLALQVSAYVLPLNTLCICQKTWLFLVEIANEWTGLFKRINRKNNSETLPVCTHFCRCNCPRYILGIPFFVPNSRTSNHLWIPYYHLPWWDLFLKPQSSYDENTLWLR